MAGQAICQQANSSNAIIHLNIETITQDDISNLNQNESQSFMRMMNGEIKTVIWVKDGKSKTEADMGFAKSVIYYDGKTKITTTLFEMMGRKMGFYSNDEEINRVMTENDSLRNQAWSPASEDIQIEYLSETKVIAQKTCKKAILHYQNKKQEDIQQIVWYYPDYKLNKDISLSSVIRSAFSPGIYKLKGFPMEMEISRSNGTITRFTVTKIETNIPIEDEAFIIPAGYDIIPMSEMNQGGRGGFQFRMQND